MITLLRNKTPAIQEEEVREILPVSKAMKKNLMLAIQKLKFYKTFFKKMCQDKATILGVIQTLPDFMFIDFQIVVQKDEVGSISKERDCFHTRGACGEAIYYTIREGDISEKAVT